MRFQRAIFSPVEIEYLKKHRDNTPLHQLTIALAKSKNAIIRKLAEIDGKPIPGKKSKRSMVGKRPDLDNQFFRSASEANVARWLKHQGIEYLFEPKQFFFPKVKRGTVSYLPDFYLPKTDQYIEVKGYLDGKGRAAIRRFKKYYPKEFAKFGAVSNRKKSATTDFFNKIGVPILAFSDELNKQCRKTIPNWE